MTTLVSTIAKRRRRLPKELLAMVSLMTTYANNTGKAVQSLLNQ